jgi:spore coat polysaccharide biosynthesis predicted glycosyltransferase SpsG
MENKVVIAIRVDSIRKLMINADLTIGAGGMATWERCF